MISPLNILVAYPYFRKGVIEQVKRFPKNSYRLIVDSGAFTAWNIGKTIKLDDYCRFLDSIDFLRPFNAVQLDVFGNPEGTWSNFQTMKRRGYDVMPVFTRGDSLHRLEEMYEHTDYIMFGGITIGGKNLNYIKWFQEHNKGRKVHWLGFCNTDFVKHYKPHSIDSSSWSSGGRFGNVHLYRGFGQTTVFNRKKLLSMPPDKVFELARNSGITTKEIGLLRDARSWVVSTNTPGLEEPENGTAMLLSTIAFVQRAADIERNLGTKFYLACGTEYQLRLVWRARQFLIERGILNGPDSSSEQRPGSKIIRLRRDGVSNEIRS